MLVLTLEPGQKVDPGSDAMVHILSVGDGVVEVGIERRFTPLSDNNEEEEKAA